MIRLIRTKENERWKKRGKWVLVYGRRKTGKSFFVKNFTKWDKYFFIGRSGEIFEGDEKISYDVFVREVFRSLENNSTIVIDEIQRLPDEFFDRLHKFGVKGNLIAISSTLYLAKELLGKRSPLLGLFSEFKIGLISEIDIIKNLHRWIKDPKKLIEIATYLREPWLVPLFEKNKKKFLESIPTNLRITIPSLVGEIFSAEEKELSCVYEGILKAVANGKRTSGEITNYLYSLKLIPAQNPSLVHPYLKVLNGIGVLEKLKFFGKNKYMYFHLSPVLDLFFYLDSKYGFTEREVAEKQIEKVLNEKIPLHVEQFFRNLLADIFGLWKEIIVEKDYEVDIALTDFKKLKLVAEVKWKKKVNEKEIRRVEEVLNRFNCKRILIVPSKQGLERKPEKIEVWDIKDVLSIINK